MKNKSIEKGDAKEVIDFLSKTIEKELSEKLKHALSLKNFKEEDVDAEREYVESMLDFILYSHHLYEYVKGGGQHAEKEAAGHEH